MINSALTAMAIAFDPSSLTYCENVATKAQA